LSACRLPESRSTQLGTVDVDLMKYFKILPLGWLPLLKGDCKLSRRPFVPSSLHNFQSRVSIAPQTFVWDLAYHRVLLIHWPCVVGMIHMCRVRIAVAVTRRINCQFAPHRRLLDNFSFCSQFRPRTCLLA